MDREDAVMDQQQACIVRNLLTQLEKKDNEAKEFMRLRNQSIKYRNDKTYPSKSAEIQENIKKNRYKDILPFDHSRVKLTFTTSKDDTDYINANFIKGVTGAKAYIATQGPLPHTVQDFWRMLWEYDVKVIVMACREFEMGKKKCERYWPLKDETSFLCGPFVIYCDGEEDKGPYMTRTLRVTNDNCEQTLKQLHYVNWPDHGVPDFIPSILDMLEEMRTYQPNDDIPLCIHCSAGCGRTGVLCVIDYTWNLLKKGMITPDFDISDLVHTMRTQRPSVVQTKEQYELVYSIIRLLFERYLQSVNEQSSKNQVTMEASASEQYVEKEESQLQSICNEGLNSMQQKQTVLPSAPGGLLMDQNNHHSQPQPLLEALTISEEGQISSQLEVPIGQEVAAVENTQQCDDTPSLNSPTSPSKVSSVCLMVEDPYFDTSFFGNQTPVNKRWTVGPHFSRPPSPPIHHTRVSDSTLVTGDHTNLDIPPPLPERTPESYQLAVDTEQSGATERLTVNIPPIETADSLQGNEESVLEQQQATSAANLNRIGTSSEWSGTSKLAGDRSQRETKPWVRSKSLKAKMLFTESLSPVWLSTTPPVAEEGSANVGGCDVIQKASLTYGGASGNAFEKRNEKGLHCKMGLKLFKDKQNLKSATPGLLRSSPKDVVTSFFKFGFGNRLGKPKGPRNYPPSWF
ncbi:tyrosine-protein phosphatase non-receptor type 22 isoform X2 [Corythoichthys intestinalis]|uniref:tyrosine-protein phosphatase non-receptor type 22 isoform X2 n=1 Tax=Corythoichthys intestinalis TaxID=161448 RepID=UPI0025A62DC6|nr:tyrosine-protein phosphatase non-receptor type 22 isoform X2 [Corythoichthys intestinalis]